MARAVDQTHLLALPTRFRDVAEWVRRAATTINGMLGQEALPYMWTDYLSDLSNARATGPNQPTWRTFKDSTGAWGFSASTLDELFITFHINHDVALGVTCKIYPHVHWTADTTNTGTCRWGFEYTYAKGHQQGAGSVFGATTTVYMEQAFSGTNFEHHIAEVSDDDAIDVSTAGIEVDGLLVCRIFRDAAHANDTLTSEAFGLMSDLHIQIERRGTVNKAPNFYTSG